MSKPASKTLIGVFVIGAIALAVLAVVVFGSGRFFSEKMPLVMYFEGSVAGLNIGSPVMFRGVKVGICLLYTSDAADDLLCVDLGGRRIIQKKTPLRYMIHLIESQYAIT